MAAIVNADTVAVQLEKVRPSVPILYERDTDGTFFSKVEKKGDKVSSRNMRIPLQLRPGGRGGLYSPDGGDMGRGSGTKYDVAQVTPVHLRFGVEINKLSEWATDSGEKAVAQVAKREVKNSMAQFRSFIDKLCQRPSTGQLGVVASNVGTVWTLAASNFRADQIFHVGQGLVVVDTTLTTVRTGTPIITQVDRVAGKITVDVNPTGLAGNDVILLEGSTISAGSVTSTALFGVPYHQNNSASGTWLNLTRANYPEVITPSVNASSGFLTTAQIRLAINLIRTTLGLDAVKSLVAYLHPCQEHAYEDLGIVISEIIKQGSSDQEMDLFFGKKKMAGVPLQTSFNADMTRVDFINFDAWGRAVMKDVDLYEVDGDTVFPVYGASGGLAAAVLYYYVTSFQLFTENPRKGSYISSLAIPTGY
jgi:hypothetical protein